MGYFNWKKSNGTYQTGHFDWDIYE